MARLRTILCLCLLSLLTAADTEYSDDDDTDDDDYDDDQEEVVDPLAEANDVGPTQHLNNIQELKHYMAEMYRRNWFPVEVIGLPESPGENTLSVVHRFGDMMGIHDVSSLRDAKRFFKERPDEDHLPRRVVGRVVSWWARADWILHNSRSNLTSRHIDPKARESIKIVMREYFPRYLLEFLVRVRKVANPCGYIATLNNDVVHISKKGVPVAYNVTTDDEFKKIVKQNVFIKDPEATEHQPEITIT